MPDFYADYPFPEVILQISDPEDFCALGDMVAGMKSGVGRVEKFVEGGVRVHPIKPDAFCEGDVLVSPSGTASIAGVSDAHPR